MQKLKALLDADPALLEARDEDGNTPLRSACAAGRNECAFFLLERGAKASVRNNWGSTPLHGACGSRRAAPALVSRLLEQGADVNARTDQSLTALHTAAIGGNLEVAQVLLSHGVDPDTVDKGSYGTALHCAIRVSANEALALCIVEHGAKSVRDPFGNTELHLASMRGFERLAQALLKHGAEVGAKNREGKTALYYAGKSGYRSIAERLLTAGADRADLRDANFGPAPQLGESLGTGEAWLWYLGGHYGGGFAVKTRGHLLIFDKSACGAGSEAGLANGQLNPLELAGQQVTVFLTKSLGSRYEAGAFGLAKALPESEWVLDAKPPEERELPPRFQVALPGTPLALGELRALPFAVCGRGNGGASGLGYLVEVDGLRILHAGFHLGGKKPQQLQRYRESLDPLAAGGSVDIAFLTVRAHVQGGYESYLILVERLQPKTIYLMGGDIASEEYEKCAAYLGAHGIPVRHPEGALPLGQRFHFTRE